MAAIWFFLPFCMLGGSFIQGIGFYSLAIIAPCLLLRPAQGGRELGWIGGLCLAMFFLFPIIGSTLTFFGYDQFATGWIDVKRFFTTPVSSVVGGSGLLILILLVLGLHRRKQLTPRQISSVENWLVYFNRGMLVAYVLLLIFVTSQYFAGFDYREASHMLPASKQMQSGVFRALGFYGHPLSLASVALALFSYYWYLFHKRGSHWQSQKLVTSRIFYAGMAGGFLLLLVMSGSRAPLLIGLFLGILLPLAARWRYFLHGPKAWLILLTAIGGVFGFIWTLDIWSRFIELWHRLQANSIDRIKFWYVHGHMFLDRPWFGHGYQQLRNGVRESYYHQHGFDYLANKYNAHNFYLECFVTIGLIGSLVALTLGGFMIFRVYRLTRSQPLAQSLFTGWLLAMGANAVHGLTQNTFFDTNLLYVYWSLLWMIIWIAMATPLEAQRASREHRGDDV